MGLLDSFNPHPNVSVTGNPVRQVVQDPATGYQYTQAHDGTWQVKYPNGNIQWGVNPPAGAVPMQHDAHGTITGGPMGPTPGSVPQLNPGAYQTPTQQFFGGSYYDSPDYQKRQADIQGVQTQEQGINAQITQLQSQLNSGLPHDQAIAIDQQIKQLQGQRQTLHDQWESMSAEADDKKNQYDQTRDIQYLGGQAQDQNAAAPVADFYGGRAPQDIGNSEADRNQQLTAASNLMNGGYQQAQQGLVNRLNADLNGNAPSLAQLQLQQGADTSLRNQQAMVASGGPMNQAFAERNAALAGAQTMQNLSMQQAQLRAQEYAQARQELGGVTGQMATQYIQGQQAAGGILNNARGSDQQMVGFDYQNALAQAQLEAQQRGLNAQQTQFFVNAYMQAQRNRQLDQQRFTEQNAGNALQAQGIAAGIQNTNTQAAVGQQRNAIDQAANDWSKTKDIVGAGAKAVSGYIGSTQNPNGSGGGSGGNGGGSNGSGDTMYGGDNYNNPTNDFGY